MKKSETNLKEKSTEELIKTLSEKEKDLINMKMDLAKGKIKNVHAAREIRKDIARLKTFLKMKELEEV
ncbi:MAG: 50S ribosomal protein L29 [Candidatus Woykebacteria bacterium]